MPPQAALELLATNREILASMQSMATTLERLSRFMHNRLDDIPKLAKMVAKNEQAIQTMAEELVRFFGWFLQSVPLRLQLTSSPHLTGRGTAKTVRPDCWGQGWYSHPSWAPEGVGAAHDWEATCWCSGGCVLVPGLHSGVSW